MIVTGKVDARTHFASPTMVVYVTRPRLSLTFLTVAESFDHAQYIIVLEARQHVNL